MVFLRAVCLKLLWRKFSSGYGCGYYLIWGIVNVCDGVCNIVNRYDMASYLHQLNQKCRVAVADAYVWCKVALRER